ncbi:hypothetical protein C2G38_2191780 [Gigaspora rosea]|uniref:Galactose oxidase n=1 Tax=Gigaspora rosea TaxID=44941 RepID=A0A397V8V8_9GLOM|nr:hypothetical protein C2G38_2191780 [Gigaspora rosea]
MEDARPTEPIPNPIQRGAAVSTGGPNKDIIFLVGGAFENSSYGIPLVYTFDTAKNVWNTPIIKGTQPTRRDHIYSIIDVTAPTPRDGYSNTLLPNGVIAYIGGYGVNGPTNLKEIYLYDTKNNAWETMITVGTIPDARAHHSSVLGLNNDRIIIYGGFYSSTSPAVAHDLSVLDIRNKPYRWFTPNISGTIPPTPSAHTANVVGRYMIVTYGFILSQQHINPDVYILDIGNDSEYKWVTSFDPKLSLTLSPNPSPNQSSIQNGYSISIGTMIGAIIGIFIGGILITIFALMIYRWYKRKHPRAIPTHGKPGDLNGLVVHPEFQYSHNNISHSSGFN